MYLRGKCDSPQTGAADHVEAEGGDRMGQTGLHCRLAETKIFYIILLYLTVPAFIIIFFMVILINIKMK